MESAGTSQADRKYHFYDKASCQVQFSKRNNPRRDSAAYECRRIMHSVLDVDYYYKVNANNLVWEWRNKIINYLEHGKLPDDPKASRALCTKAARYSFNGGQLYRRSFQGPLARCLGASEAKYVIREFHEGVCVNHSSTDSLVLKLIRAGYYWLRMEQDTMAYVQKYDKCQRHTPLVHQPVELLHSISSSWPFMKWGMDIVGPLPPAPDKVPTKISVSAK
nr:uncharacterized protein LOC104118784 [Nicotiana tomentosiformis]